MCNSNIKRSLAYTFNLLLMPFLRSHLVFNKNLFMIYTLKLKQQPLALINLSSKLFEYKFEQIKSIR